jgi:dipeptide/tripeptide permease
VKGTRGREGAFAGAWRLGLAGFFAIAVAFGPARSGFGLFLPDFRREFGLSTERSGVITGGSYGGYLVALSLVGLFAARFGPRLFVTVGGISATTGMILVAIAPNAPLLATGLILAASYAGWSWSPYNDAVGARGPISVERPGAVGHKHWHHLRPRDGRPYRASGRSLGLAPAAWAVVGVSAASLGAGIMCTSALLSVWSSLLYPEQLSTGFSAVLLFLGIGTIVGPMALGTFAGRSGLDAAFLVAGALALLTALVAALARTLEDPSVRPAPRPAQER